MDSNENDEKLSFDERLRKEQLKPETLREDIDRLSAHLKHCAAENKVALEEIKNLRSKNSELESRLKATRQEEKKLYLVPLFAVVTFVAFLVYRGWAEKPEVTIDFNVGEIIGGSLAGLGALIAGVTYAYRRTMRGE